MRFSFLKRLMPRVISAVLAAGTLSMSVTLPQLTTAAFADDTTTTPTAYTVEYTPHQTALIGENVYNTCNSNPEGVSITGVTLGTTTVAELKAMYSTISLDKSVSEIVQSVSEEGLTASDFSLKWIVQTGANYETYDTFDGDTLDTSKISSDYDSNPIRNISLSIALDYDKAASYVDKIIYINKQSDIGGYATFDVSAFGPYTLSYDSSANEFSYQFELTIAELAELNGLAVGDNAATVLSKLSGIKVTGKDKLFLSTSDFAGSDVNVEFWMGFDSNTDNRSTVYGYNCLDLISGGLTTDGKDHIADGITTSDNRTLYHLTVEVSIYGQNGTTPSYDTIQIDDEEIQTDDEEIVKTGVVDYEPHQVQITINKDSKGNKYAYAFDYVTVPGVTDGTTTVAELREMYDSIEFNGLEVTSVSDSDLNTWDFMVGCEICTSDGRYWEYTTTSGYTFDLSKLDGNEYIKDDSVVVGIFAMFALYNSDKLAEYDVGTTFILNQQEGEGLYKTIDISTLGDINLKVPQEGVEYFKASYDLEALTDKGIDLGIAIGDTPAAVLQNFPGFFTTGYDKLYSTDAFVLVYATYAYYELCFEDTSGNKQYLYSYSGREIYDGLVNLKNDSTTSWTLSEFNLNLENFPSLDDSENFGKYYTVGDTVTLTTDASKKDDGSGLDYVYNYEPHEIVMEVSNGEGGWSACSETLDLNKGTYQKITVAEFKELYKSFTIDNVNITDLTCDGKELPLDSVSTNWFIHTGEDPESYDHWITGDGLTFTSEDLDKINGLDDDDYVVGFGLEFHLDNDVAKTLENGAIVKINSDQSEAKYYAYDLTQYGDIEFVISSDNVLKTGDDWYYSFDDDTELAQFGLKKGATPKEVLEKLSGFYAENKLKLYSTDARLNSAKITGEFLIGFSTTVNGEYKWVGQYGWDRADLTSYLSRLDDSCKLESIKFNLSLRDYDTSTAPDSVTFTPDASKHAHEYTLASDASGHWYECRCGAKKGEVTAHSASNWIVDVPASPIAEGTQHKKCTVCGYVVETGAIPMLIDDSELFDENAKEAKTSVETDNVAEDEIDPLMQAEANRVTDVAITPCKDLKTKDGTEVKAENVKITAKEIVDSKTRSDMKASLEKTLEKEGSELGDNAHINVLDLGLKNGEEDISDNYDGLIKIVIPIPEGFKGSKFNVYRMTDKDAGDDTHIILGAHDYEVEAIDCECDGENVIFYLEHFSTYLLAQDSEFEGATVSGSVTTTENKIATSVDATIKLLDSTGAEVKSVTGSSFSFGLVENGKYTLRVSAPKYCPRDYTVTVDGSDVTVNAEIYHYGDVNFDGEINASDATQVLREYVGITSSFTGDDGSTRAYRKAVANVKADGEIDASDATQILRYYVGITSTIDNLA